MVWWRADKQLSLVQCWIHTVAQQWEYCWVKMAQNILLSVMVMKRNCKIEAYGHHAYLRIKFKSKIIIDSIITLIKGRKKTQYLLFENRLILHLNKLESTKDTLSQIWLKSDHLFWGRIFLNFVNVFLLFHNYILLEKGDENLTWFLNLGELKLWLIFAKI